MKDPLGVSPSKGNQGTTRGKEKNSFDRRIRSTVTLPTELRGRTERVEDDYGLPGENMHLLVYRLTCYK